MATGQEECGNTSVLVNMLDLPPEMLEHIMFFLNVHDLVALSSCCRLFSTLPWPCISNLQQHAMPFNTILSKRPRHLRLDAKPPDFPCEGFRGVSGLHSLVVAGSFPPAGIDEIISCLKQWPALWSLDLRKNHVSHLSVLKLAQALCSSCKLRQLSVSSCYLQPRSVFALSSTLRVNSTLTFLNLCGNKLGDEQAVALAAALQANQSLESCKLFDNSIGDEGACAISLMLKRNQTLRFLDFGYNNVCIFGLTRF